MTGGKYRYGMFENAGHWFPGVKATAVTALSASVSEQLDIPALLSDAHQRLNGSPSRELWG